MIAADFACARRGDARLYKCSSCAVDSHAPPNRTPIGTKGGLSASVRPGGLGGQSLAGGRRINRISIDMPSFTQERFKPYPLAFELEDFG